ncbi:MAG: hypothetical protein EPO28_16560 [Saprospiraceae bacterium]|nr:MAG: hypothetical protein EPO28_16560 [Saprospiraceae bacterium]
MRNSQSPSIYAIYHNALPYYHDRLDICSLDQSGKLFAATWVKNLLKGQLSNQVNGTATSLDKLRHLYFESRNYEKTCGAKSFGFGYPLLIDTQESDLLVAPLFIWPLTIEPAQTRVDAWVLKLEQGQYVVPNYRLFRHLKLKYDIDFLGEALALSSNGRINSTELEAFCGKIAGRLQFLNEPVDAMVGQCPGIDEIGKYSEKGAVHWSGVLSLFPPQQTRIFSGGYKPEELFTEQKVEEGEPPLVFPFLAPSPEQQSALEMIERYKISVIESRSTQAKTETLTNLLINALSRGKRCLVVSERAPTLKYLQSEVSRTGLNQLHFLLDDAVNDALPLLELLRVAAIGSSRSISYNDEDFQLKKNNYIRHKQKMDAAYSAVMSKVFGENGWTETTGLFLASNRVEGKELLASQLNSQDFDFKQPEFDIIRQGILACQPLFRKVKTLSHPLNNLHQNIFLGYSKEEAAEFVQVQLGKHLAATAKLHHRYINKLDGYAARLKLHFEDNYQEFAHKTEVLLNQIASYSDTLGDNFLNAGARQSLLPVFFSAKKKRLTAAQEHVSKLYLPLVREFEANPFFDFHFQPCKDGKNIPKTRENLSSFSASLKQWGQRLDTLVQDELLRLNSKTAHPDLDYNEQIRDLEYGLDLMLEELNESNLYRKGFENKTLTIPQRQKYLESIIEQLETTQLNLRDFEIFYQWQTEWLNLSPLGQKVIRALVKVKPKDWMAAFESWYFNNLLKATDEHALPTDSLLVENVANSWYALRPLIINQILKLWQTRQSDELKALKKKNRKVYRNIFEKAKPWKGNVPLESLLAEGIEAVTSFLPLLFVTPHVALNVIPAAEKFFDYVVFAGASRLSVESASKIAPLGKQTVICGANDGFGSETSIIQYALENEVPATHLTDSFSTQGEPGAGKAPVVTNVKGRYHELEGTNDVEAQLIIRLLNQIKQTPQRIYPKVGIVTWTVEQRNLIYSYLLKLKQQNAGTSEKILQLERNGLGVHFIDELYGQQFDILLLSFTYGPVNLVGKMTKKMVFMNTPEGVSRMSMLVGKPVEEMHIVHSIPAVEIQKYQTKKHDKGTWLLAHLIGWGEAWSNENKAGIKVAMEALGKKDHSKVEKTVFTAEIMNALKPYLDERRMSRSVVFGSLHLPLCIKPIYENEPPVVLQPDGFFGKTTFTSGIWEFQQRKKLEVEGFEILPIWSVKWLKGSAQEARVLASKIIKQDAKYKSREKSENEKIDTTD